MSLGRPWWAALPASPLHVAAKQVSLKSSPILLLPPGFLIHKWFWPRMLAMPVPPGPSLLAPTRAGTSTGTRPARDTPSRQGEWRRCSPGKAAQGRWSGSWSPLVLAWVAGGARPPPAGSTPAPPPRLGLSAAAAAAAAAENRNLRLQFVSLFIESPHLTLTSPAAQGRYFSISIFQGQQRVP